VHVKGFASNGAGASMHGGLLVIDGDAGLRCGISLKGGDIVVGGSVGSFSAFMAQAGRMVICGDAGDALGDSLYEAVLYVKGKVKSLGADAQYEEMTDADIAAVASLLDQAGLDHDPKAFRRIASQRPCTTGTPTPTRNIDQRGPRSDQVRPAPPTGPARHQTESGRRT
jgi:glutamate synthase domain-containing protein 3